MEGFKLSVIFAVIVIVRRLKNVQIVLLSVVI